MDSYASGGIGATLVLVIGVLYKFIDHKRLRSQCCGYTASVGIEDVTPKEPEDKIESHPAVEPKQKEPEDK
jgi:hypothetical protein